MSIFGPREAKIQGHMMVGLSELGKRTAEQVLDKGPTFTILSLLNERSPRSISEIANDADLDVADVRSRIRVLARNGYVRLMSGEN